MPDIEEYLPGMRNNDGGVYIEADHIIGLEDLPFGKSSFTKSVAPEGSGFNADYYTDGLEDNEQIQEAIDASEGGTVLLLEGTYSIISSLLIPSNTILRGVSMWKTIIKGADNSNINYAVQNKNYLTSDTNITIENLQIDCNGTNQSSTFAANGIRLRLVSQFQVNNVFVQNAGYDDGTQAAGMGTDQSTKGTFNNCMVRGSTHYGFTIYRSHEILVRGCIAYECGRHGYGASSDNQGDVTNDVTFDSCIAFGNCQGFWCREINGLSINNCEINGNNVPDISVGQTTFGIILSSVQNVNITNNRISNIGGSNDAIRIDGQYADPGEYSSYLNITGNQIYNIAKNGIFLRETGTGTSKSVVSNNVIKDCINGSAIIAQSSSDVVISGNYIEGNGTSGIIAVGTLPGNNFVINSNISKNNGLLGVSGNTYGIVIKGYCFTVIGNTCYDDQIVQTQTHGIREQADGDSSIIFGNNLIGNAITGLMVDGTNHFLGFNKGGTENFETTEQIDILRSSSATSILSFPTGLSVTNDDTTNNNGIQISFVGVDSIGNRREFASIKSIYTDHDSASIDGDLAFFSSISNSRTELARFHLGLFGIGVTAPTNRLELASSTSSTGGIGFGTDTNLYRSAANTLKTDDSLIISAALTVTTAFAHLGTTAGFFNATPVTKPTAYTQTYATADKTISAYTSDTESVAYTGIDNAQAGTPYAQLTDINALRVAYENLRAFSEDTTQALNSLIDDLQSLGLVS